jgi:glycosyltransferase involved in cell wall biosynthesis
MRSHLKILHLVPYYEPAFGYGGPVRSVSALCKALARQGAEVTVFTTNADGDDSLDVPVASPVDADGVRVYYFQRERPKRFFRSTGLLQAACERVQEFDLVHSCSLWTYVMHAATQACANSGVPRIDSPRGGLMPWDFGHRYWKKRLYLALGGWRQLNAAAGIHCTDSLEADAIKRLRLKPATYIVPNAVESEAFGVLPPRGQLRSQLGLPEASTITLFLGRLSAKKGIDLSLQAFHGVIQQHKDAVFVVAGPDDEETGRKAQKLAAHLGLGDRVRFIGEVRGQARLAALADADMFILTSHSENFGMAPAEAMAAGLPVLLSDQTGICRGALAAGAGEVAALTRPDITRKWSRMLDDPENLRIMGQRGREFVRREYDPLAVARRMIDVYEEVISGSRARSRGKVTAGSSAH